MPTLFGSYLIKLVIRSQEHLHMKLDRIHMLCLRSVYWLYLDTAFVYGAIKRLKGHLVDALALRGDEGRNTLR